MSELLKDLNEPQQQAVLHQTGPLLVLAGAGSGKTRVITRRIAHLVKERQVPPWRIFAVTFTNKAAKEMRERLVALLGEEAARELTVSTFHSAAAMLLRREAKAAGLDSSFVIYDEGDQLQLVRRALREAGMDPAGSNAREYLGRIDAEKNAGRLPAQMPVGDNLRDKMAHRVYTEYQRLLRAANAVDFGDLLLLWVEVLRNHPEVRVKYQRRFLHVLVDEFQDTNPVQYQLLKLMAPPASNLVVVGDDDQSIYRWRGAAVDNILGFPKDYPGTVVVKLEQNYRSDQTILEAAHAVISQNRRRMDKKLWSQRAQGEPLTLLINRDERQEAQEVAARIHALRRDGIVDYAGCAVFYRTNAQSRVLEETFRLARVPYTLVSGRSFYDRAEIRDAAAYLRLMVNPKSDADLSRIINTPPRGIGDTTEERLTEAAREQGLSLFETLEWPERIPQLNSGAVKRLLGFKQLLDKLVAFGKSAPDASSATAFMLKETGLLQSHQAEGSVESQTRAENLSELLSATREFDKARAEAAPAAPPAPIEGEDNAPLAQEAPPLQAFLEQISLVGEADAEVGEGKVSVMTLHAAKGLEFDAVFMTGMEEDLFPHRRATAPDADPEEMSEERRLCYVGFTRARRRLHVSLCTSRVVFGEFKQNPPSRFLSEVPKELFGFAEPLPSATRQAALPRVRRGYYEDEHPQVDTSYDQSVEASQHTGDVRGLRVTHAQFGRGVVVDARGQGPTAKLLVRFESVGEKTVVARFLSPG